MENEIKTKLEEEIDREIREMSLQIPDSDGYSEATDRLAKLYDLKIKERQAESEMQLKTAQAESEKKQFWIKTVIDAAAIVLPLGFYGMWMKRGLDFEKTGTFTSQTFRGLINLFKPKR